MLLDAEDNGRGFVSSANQLPVDTSYPYYLGIDYPEYRGLIINRKLNGMARWASSTGGSDRRHQLLRKRGLLHPLELL